VKIPFQAHIVHNQAKLVLTGNFEEKPKPVPTCVRVIEVNTESFFITNERWKDREELLDWIRRQAARAGFTISIDKSSTITPYMMMQCGRSGEYKPPKTRKKPKLEGTGSRKCDCPFGLKCFFEKKLVDCNALGNSQLWLGAKVIQGPSCGSTKSGGEAKELSTWQRAWRRLGIFSQIWRKKTKKVWHSSSKCIMRELDGARGIKRTRRSCNTWFQSWRSINVSISQEQTARKPLLKIYSLLIRIQLICLTLFPPFWSWTPLTKPIPTEYRYLRLLVSRLPNWRIRLRLHIFPLKERITSFGHLRCWCWGKIPN